VIITGLSHQSKAGVDQLAMKETLFKHVQQSLTVSIVANSTAALL
jgi:hypothetical protein